MSDCLKRVFRGSAWEGLLIMGILNAHGIDATIPHRYALDQYAACQHLMGVDVVVPKRQSLKANRIISEARDSGDAGSDG